MDEGLLNLIKRVENSVRDAKYASDVAGRWAARNSSAKRSISVTRQRLEKSDRVNRGPLEKMLADYEKREKESAEEMAKTREKVGSAEEQAGKVINCTAREISRMPSEKIIMALEYLMWKIEGVW